MVVAPTQKAQSRRGARKGGGTRNNNASSSSSKISLSSSTLLAFAGRRRPEKQRRPPLVKRVALEKVAEEGALVSSTSSSSSARRRGNHHHHHHQCRRVFPSSGEERVTSSSSLAFGTTSTRTRTETAKKRGTENNGDKTTTPPPDEQQRPKGAPVMTTLEKEDDEDSGDDDGPMGSSFPELDYLQELIAIQKDCPKEIGFFGTRNMGFLHQQLIEILAYALCLTGNHIFTSGATGTNAAVIRGSLRAERPELLTVVLPQSLSKQPAESRELLEKVSQVEECPDNDHLPLLEASRICNDVIVSKVRQVICFAFHDSTLLLDTCREAKVQRRMVTLFYLD